MSQDTLTVAPRRRSECELDAFGPRPALDGERTVAVCLVGSLHTGVAPFDSVERLLAESRPPFFSRSRAPINPVREGTRPAPAKLHPWRGSLTAAQIARTEARCHEQVGWTGRDLTGPVNDTPARIRDQVVGRLRDLTNAARYAWYWTELPLSWMLRRLVSAVGSAR